MQRLLQYKIPGLWRAAPACPKCHGVYKNTKFKSPYILKCGHSMCRSCISQSRHIVCIVCEQTTRINGGNHFRDELSQDLYCLGQACYTYNDDDKTNFRSNEGIPVPVAGLDEAVDQVTARYRFLHAKMQLEEEEILSALRAASLDNKRFRYTNNN